MLKQVGVAIVPEAWARGLPRSEAGVKYVGW